jgi:excisionase family DNA binding protein
MSSGAAGAASVTARNRHEVTLSPQAQNGRLLSLQANDSRRPPEPVMPDHTHVSQRDLLTITEAAELLRAPVATLRYWRHLGTGPLSFRLGRRVLYRRDDLHAWIDAQHDRAGTTPA